MKRARVARWSLGSILAATVLAAVTWLAPTIHSQRSTEGQPVTYVAIGASDAVGIGADNPERESWVAELHRRLPGGSRLVNLGVSGALAEQAVNQQLPVALASGPDVLTIWMAVNDINARVDRERYRDHLATLVRSVRESTAATVLVGNVPDLRMLPFYQRVNRPGLAEEVARWNSTIADVCTETGAVLVDLHTEWKHLERPDLLIGRDGFHPSTLGHTMLAELFHQRYRAATVIAQ